MDAILDKLTEIEMQRLRLFVMQKSKKTYLDRNLMKNGKNLTRNLENKTKARLEKIREQLEKEQSRVLNSSSGASEDTICSSGKNMKRSIQNMRMRY